ncbi:hypothetical protein ACFFNY_31330 [Paenibacillus hodogayensis]|uniref:Right handed beta helix domain-containing protein n=1 Tax=Paenibacillus hodogayensis TaxID=279208 RepID=A0ABV5W695_9BACL
MEHETNVEGPSLPSRRRLLAALGGAGVALAGSAMLQESSWGQSITSATYGSGGSTGAGIGCRAYATVADLKADTSIVEGMLVMTAGYYAPDDGGASEYVIRAGTLVDDGGSVIDVQNGLQAVLLVKGHIRYKQFGTVSDGVNDDGGQIKKAHAFANTRRVPVIDEAGEYWIKQTTMIVIQTNVRWGQSKFHIDESFNSKAQARFHVLSRQDPAAISFDAATKASFLARMRPGTTLVPELAAYKNTLVFIVDDNDKIGARYGYPGQNGWSKEDFFYVEEHGRIVGEIAWSFNDYTSLTAYPAEESYLVIDGGSFLLSGNNPGNNNSAYWYNGFLVKRSRTTIRNQWVGLEHGASDTSLDPRYGFYYFNYAYEVMLENVRAIPYEQNRPGTEYVLIGTYGIGGRRVLNATFRNVTAEGSMYHWGVFGTNLFKNFRIEGCRLNRVDVHFHCWNLYVSDSEIGYRGFTLTGGGDLVIENTKRYGNQFIGFRQDFGARWDGHIRIRNCRLIVENGGAQVTGLDFRPADFDYKYSIGYGRSIHMENFVFDYTGQTNVNGACQLIRLAGFSKIASTGSRLFFPQWIECRNITVAGRDQGVRIMQISNPFSFDVGRAGGLDGQRLLTNCYMRFENIDGEKVPPQPSEGTASSSFLLNALGTTPYDDQYALFPKIEFIHVGDFWGHFKGAAANVTVRDSTVNCMDNYSGGQMRGSLVLDQCDIRPDAVDDGKVLYTLNAQFGTTFLNCTIHAPILNGVARPDLFARHGFIDINQKLMWNHVNTTLAKQLVDYYAGIGNPVLPEFYAMLKSHHASQGSQMARRKGTTAQRPSPASFLSEPGFTYFDTEQQQLVVWDGAQWVAPSKGGDVWSFYLAGLSSAPAGTSFKRSEAHPSQMYMASRSGSVKAFTAYVNAPTPGPSFTFELWKDGSLWIGGLAGPGASGNPLMSPVTGAAFGAGSRIEVRFTGADGGLVSGAYATLDLHIGY